MFHNAMIEDASMNERMGLVEAERFVMLIRNDSFDYTKWCENLFEDMTLEELSQKAMEFRQN